MSTKTSKSTFVVTNTIKAAVKPLVVAASQSSKELDASLDAISSKVAGLVSTNKEYGLVIDRTCKSLPAYAVGILKGYKPFETKASKPSVPSFPKGIVRSQKNSKKSVADLEEDIKVLQARKRLQTLIEAGLEYTTR